MCIVVYFLHKRVLHVTLSKHQTYCFAKWMWDIKYRVNSKMIVLRGTPIIEAHICTIILCITCIYTHSHTHVQLSLAEQDNVTPITLLHNSAAHLLGPSRSLGAIMCGYSGIRLFEPQVSDVFFSPE